MKIFIRNRAVIIPLAIILFLTVTCADPKTDNGIVEASAYLDVTLNVSGEQVWMPNYNTGKVSQMLLKFKGDRDVDVIVEVIDYGDDDELVSEIKHVGAGKIEKGILSFKVDEMDNSDLLDSDDLLYFYFKDWFKTGGNNIVMTPKVKGNIITLVTLYNDDSGKEPIEAVIREGFSGTSDSLKGEYIYYLYVNADCTISAGKVEKTDFKYTFNEFELLLKRGWNTICKSETYTTIGDSSYTMTVKNPAINWVMQKTK